MAFQRRENFSCFVVFALANQQTGAVGEERAQGPNAKRKEDLESQRESPGNVTWSKGEA